MANRLLTLAVAMTLSGAVFAAPRNDPVMLQAREIQQSSLPDDQKIKKLRDLLADRPVPLLYSLESVHAGEGVRWGMDRFRDPSTPRPVRLAIGHDLVSYFYSADFANEFAQYALAMALDGGEQEFMQNRQALVRTAVGEIAYMSAGFEGQPRHLFDKVTDPRLIPIFTRCLDAPDDVYPVDQSDVVMGKPGEPSGRNIPRQLLPIALARLKAANAVPKLADLARNHHDSVLRINCAYAVANMGDAKTVNDLSDHLRRQPPSPERQIALLNFGKGLLERGDERGIGYMSLRESGDQHAEHPAAVLYNLEQRLEPMEKIRTPATVAFYREVLDYDPLLDLLRFDPEKLDIPDPPGLLGHQSPAAMLAQSRPRILSAYRRITDQVVANQLKTLAPALRKIADTTKDQEIKDVSLQAIRQLAPN